MAIQMWTCRNHFSCDHEADPTVFMHLEGYLMSDPQLNDRALGLIFSICILFWEGWYGSKLIFPSKLPEFELFTPIFALF